MFLNEKTQKLSAPGSNTRTFEKQTDQVSLDIHCVYRLMMQLHLEMVEKQCAYNEYFP